MSRLSITIPNWNGEDLLPGCLDPLTDAGFEVIVVDNGSKDGSVELLRTRYPWVRLIANDDNRGFAVANNQGIAAGGGDYVLLLNNDTVPNTTAIKEAVAFLDNHPEAGIAGPSLANPDGSRQPSCGPGPNLRTELLAKTMLHRLLPGIRERAPDRTCPVDWVTGAALFIRRELARSLGGLDEGLFLFYEDLDLCARARERGYEVWFVATDPIVHIGGASRKKVEAESLVHGYRSTERFFTRHGPAWRRRLLRVATVGEMALRGTLWALLGLHPDRRRLAGERLQAYRAIMRLATTRRSHDTG